MTPNPCSIRPWRLALAIGLACSAAPVLAQITVYDHPNFEGRAVTILGEGKGGPAGYAKGGAQVTLEPIADGTRLTYTVDASVGGKIAQLGSRIIDSFAKKLADAFFENFQQAVEGPAEEDVASETGAKKGWFKRIIGA